MGKLLCAADVCNAPMPQANQMLGHQNRPKTPHQAHQKPIFGIGFASNPCYNGLRWFFIGEQAEWLKALVLKVLPEPEKPYKPRVSPMFDIGFLFFMRASDGGSSDKRLPSDLRKIGWQGI